jgi:YD repeat-containing protein
LNNLGRCNLITDRNGNQITITYPNSHEVDYTDQLGRLTKLEMNPAPSVALRVTFLGYNGAQRVFTVTADTMNLHYRTDNYTTWPVINGDNDPLGFGYGWPNNTIRLYQSSYGLEVERIDTQAVVTQLTLPDGRALNFNYNQFGEVAEVQMPTGGKVQYDYQSAAYDSGTGVGGLPTGNSMDCEARPGPSQAFCDVTAIDRAVITRRTYPDGSTLEATWTYT